MFDAAHYPRDVPLSLSINLHAHSPPAYLSLQEDWQTIIAQFLYIVETGEGVERGVSWIALMNHLSGKAPRHVGWIIKEIKNNSKHSDVPIKCHYMLPMKRAMSWYQCVDDE